MVFTLSNIGRKNNSRASLLYCANICGPGTQVLSKFQNNGWNSTINPYGTSVSSKVASYVALVNGGFGGRPTWSIKVPGSRFGMANPPSYNPEKYLNQYGRLKGTGGQPLRNF
jgi:hypothetical protein